MHCSYHSLKQLFQNKYLVLAFLGGALLQTIVVIVPKFAGIFKLTSLNGEQWLYTIGISLMPIILMEVQKFVNQWKFGKIIHKENKSEVCNFEHI